MTEQVLFTEKQRFNQTWLWILMGVIIIMPMYDIVTQLVKDIQGVKPDGFRSINYVQVLIFLIPLFMWVSKLETRITNTGIDARFFPFHRKNRHFAWDDIDSAVVRTYSPLGEYGGWGLRWGSSGKAYNVSGEEGIQLVLKNGKKLLIGTNKPVEAAAALAVYMPVK